jgi:hypothetical protein
MALYSVGHSEEDEPRTLTKNIEADYIAIEGAHSPEVVDPQTELG